MTTRQQEHADRVQKDSPMRKIVRFTIQNVTPTERELGQVMRKRIATLAAIDPAVVSAMVAAGPLNTENEFVSATIDAYVRSQGNPEHEANVRALIRTHSDSDVDDNLTSLVISCSESGYQLGLAVGLALGSGNPFGAGVSQKGGAR